jgi:hypothetical protein
MQGTSTKSRWNFHEKSVERSDLSHLDPYIIKPGLHKVIKGLLRVSYKPLDTQHDLDNPN